MVHLKNIVYLIFLSLETFNIMFQKAKTLTDWGLLSCELRETAASNFMRELDEYHE